MRNALRIPILLISGTATLGAQAPLVFPLWPDGAPGYESRRDEPELAGDYWIRNIHNPSITVFLPSREKANGAAVLICPGGGHRELVFKAEGVEAAKYLNTLGVTAFVLKYRLGREADSPYSVAEHPRQDAQRAMRLIRSRAAEWGVDRNRLGMLGFSAGGEVVSMVAYASGDGDPAAPDPIDRETCRPDFQILIYPGPLGIPKTIPTNAPPAFLLVANDDRGASAVTIDLLKKYRAARVPVELHLYAQGGHAFNMGNRSSLATVSTWPNRMADWLNDSGLLTSARSAK